MKTIEEDEARYAFRRSVEVIKEHIPLAEYAATLTELKPTGPYRLVGLCPLPGHDEKTPSFTVYTATQSWYCFGCLRGLDVLDLHQLMHSYDAKWEALVDLSMRYNVELPGRSERWHKATHRKAAYEEARARVLGNILKRRLFRVLILPVIDNIEDPEEHDRELERAWEEFDDALLFSELAIEAIAKDLGDQAKTSIDEAVS